HWLIAMESFQPGGTMQPSALPSSTGSLAMYLAEINKYPLLTVDEEQRLARLYARSANLDAAHKLVTSNLRFVVKVAYEYRSYGIKMADLIQEGNIGLMKAVQKFDADKGIRLISYAVWWIRAFIQNYILKSWSLVKLGTTQAQRKLFFSLARTRRELEKFDGTEQVGADEKAIARKLRVKPGEVVEMQQRMECRDLSLDAPMDGGPCAGRGRRAGGRVGVGASGGRVGRPGERGGRRWLSAALGLERSYRRFGRPPGPQAYGRLYPHPQPWSGVPCEVTHMPAFS